MSSGSALSSVEEYDPLTDTWRETTPIRVAREFLGAAQASNGKIYVIGGKVPGDQPAPTEEGTVIDGGGPAFSVLQAGVRPTIDGCLWGNGAHFRLFIWTEAAPPASPARKPARRRPTSSADPRSAWRPGLLYFAAAVTDDVLVGNQSAKAWNDDAVELSLLRSRPRARRTSSPSACSGRQYHNGSGQHVAHRRHPHRARRLDPRSRHPGLGPRPADALAAGQEYPFTFAPLGR